MSIEYHYVLVASDHQESPIRREANTLDWILLPIEVKELQTLELEVVAVILIDLKYFKDAFVIAHSEILAIRRKVTTFGWMSQLYGVYETVLPG